MVKEISDNEIYSLIKYIKSVLWRVAKRLSYIEDARCLTVKNVTHTAVSPCDQYSEHSMLKPALRTYNKADG